MERARQRPLHVVKLVRCCMCHAVCRLCALRVHYVTFCTHALKYVPLTPCSISTANAHLGRDIYAGWCKMRHAPHFTGAMVFNMLISWACLSLVSYVVVLVAVLAAELPSVGAFVNPIFTTVGSSFAVWVLKYIVSFAVGKRISGADVRTIKYPAHFAAYDLLQTCFGLIGGLSSALGLLLVTVFTSLLGMMRADMPRSFIHSYYRAVISAYFFHRAHASRVARHADRDTSRVGFDDERKYRGQAYQEAA
jgi:hypothetical protein